MADSIETVILGKRDVVERVLLCLLADGHLLIEDVPGVGKTSLAKALAASVATSFGRIQFTPDVLPSDVVGVDVWNEQRSEFEFRAGAIFANIVLVDEINRASPKTQAALLESMQERQVTTDGVTRRLERPFMVIATQNPLEHEGTYPLPESQLDRFMMRISVGYPDTAAALDVLDAHGGMLDDEPAVVPVATAEELTAMTRAVSEVHVAPVLRRYIVALADGTRRHRAIALGMSPRASLNLQRVAQARAASQGRGYVVPDDIKTVADSVMCHRLLLNTNAQLQGMTTHQALAEVLSTVPVPSTEA
ncbi:MAG TPA: ATPase [Acidimicrobiaceae bacterium]|nr:ATPase [Acidimicrobiaceae bacterium]